MYETGTFAEGYAIGRDSAGNNNNGMWGDNGAWWIIILLIFGWGGNGFGGFGGNNAMNGALTRGDLCMDMNFNNVENGVRAISNGISESTFALNNTMTNGFAGIQSTLCQGFNGVNTSILTSANQTQQAITNVGYNMQSGFCDLGRQIERTNYAIAQQTCDLINNQNSNTQRILDFMCQEKIAALQAENALLTSQLSQNSQTAQILNAINPPVNPAYIVPNPRAYYNYNNNCNGL